ncbi:MAG: hypothetical protein J0I45_00145 [Bosea sp.]|nr:hypothetical protein [Bosea sp. (in: a-proteobacteria)]
MPITFDLTDFERLTAKLGGAADQLPFALANAMTSAAFRTRAGLTDDVWPKAVNARNKRFLGVALNIEKATKRNLRIGIIDGLGRGHLALHAKGGTKQAKKRLAIPATGAVKRTAKGVRKDQTPRAIIANTPKRALRVLPAGIFVGKQGRLHLVYSFKPSAHVNSDVPFYDSFDRAMRFEMRRQFPLALANAMKTRGLKGYARSVAMGRARSSALASQWADRGGLDAFYSWSRGNNGFRSDGSR